MIETTTHGPRTALILRILKHCKDKASSFDIILTQLQGDKAVIWDKNQIFQFSVEMSGIACLGVDQTQVSKRWGSTRPNSSESGAISVLGLRLV